MNTSDITIEIKSAMKSGKIFNVTFVKKDGSVRNMTARMGVKKHHVNTPSIPSSVSHLPKYLTVFDMQKAGYRNVNVDAIINFKCGVVMATLPEPVQESIIKQGTGCPDFNFDEAIHLNFQELM